MLALADHAYEDGTGIRPSIKRIAWKTGYSERSVQSIMSQLRELGLLVVVAPATHNTPNEYRFNWAAVTLKPSFDEYMDVAKGRKNRGAISAPLLNSSDRGAISVEGCNSGARGVQFPCNRGAVSGQQGCSPAHPIRQEPLREPSKETKEETKKEIFQFGAVRYQQPPDEIDLAELWSRNPGMAKDQIRFLAPGHKRPEMVAHGFGQWWVGPTLNDFDEFLIKACQKRKQKLEQPDSVGDAKTFINNMLKNGDWANFSLRCDEATELQDRASVAQVATAEARSPKPAATPVISALERTETEQREAAIGLLKFKISRGEIAWAKKLADMKGILYSEIGLTADGEKPDKFSIPEAS
ncbi:MAG: hypothetical protein DCF15_15585 [Phormidesmis priestleyi]|uniref:Helix-turn-helix domain-containing protein n=1 Tax=Phormidesmis priestleyi TaxID=268141 RepID=A0A2W4X590_9CYAN|nr:MAG: hypothetical protein DCF15_15585 [Phormidesmis priestleyi]